MKLLLCLSFILECWSLAVPLQKPLRVQEHVEKLPWTEQNCIPTITSAGNDTMCIQAVFDEVKDPVIGGPTQYCGFISFKARNTKMFFWLVMSETTDPKTSPVVVWMNGGPGVSSLLGLWDQWGPRLFNHGKPASVEFIDNPDRLTEKMSWIFLEQPAGVGYSRSTANIVDSISAARDISAFLDGILRTAKFKYKGSPISLSGAPLHIAGESFAGHYIPALGSLMVKSGQAKALKLQSLFCGNGAIDITLTGPGILELICSSDPPLDFGSSRKLDLSCIAQMVRIPSCSRAIDDCRKKKTPAACELVAEPCAPTWGWTWGKDFDKNPYDATKKFSKDKEQTDYYDGPMYAFLNDAARKTSFGVEKSTTWSWSNDVMNHNFRKGGDDYRNFRPEIGHILDAGIDFMLYAGDTDLVDPFTSVKANARLVDWKEIETMPGFALKRDRFRACAAKDDKEYSTISRPGEPLPYGNYVRAGHFNYVRVFGAGHMINENKPAEAKHLFETWVFNRGTFGECSPT